MKTLVLHIGMAKTGSTTIQNSLGSASAALAQEGIVCAPWQPYNHSFDFTVLFMQNPKKSFLYKQLSPIDDEAWESELQCLRQQWTGLFSGITEGTCIVSAENLTRLSRDEIEQLRLFVDPYFDCVRAIAYVRDPLKSLKSQWEQDVKEMQQPVDAETLLQGTKQRMGYRFLERWMESVGEENLVLRRFDPAAFHNGSLLDDFFHALDLPSPADIALEEVSSNQSLGADGVAFLLELNSRYPQYKDGAYNPDRGLARRLHLFYQALRKASRQPLSMVLQFDEEEAARFNRKVGILNRFLSAEDAFSEVQASAEKTQLPSADAIPPEYYVELVNEMAQLIDTFADRNDALVAENKRLSEMLAAAQASAGEGDAQGE
ncbi:hypothetical protein F0M18_03600 [Pseudohalioglobus sediminis]|uniref:Sulfotransferase family protein n=1 Tax=Pseudohalioglobus sediminis TaxID=2606449 RepID=A0A5B0X5J1_9GAMM|nr:hypothetical protein [Pseudohalioglobus sediminis]KAA1194522.1 hypothetical protein F0M18_03600 [Pseudohalioglobus sediminis]